MTSIEERLAVAYGLIRHKRYSEARAILQKLKHPKAREWLKKLDEVDGTKQRRTRRRNCVINLIGWVFASIGIVVLTLIVIAYLAGLRDQGAGTARARMFSYCLDVYIEVDDLDGMDGCSEWLDGAFPVYRDKVIACHQQSPTLDAPFHDCLVAEDILPPGIIRR